MTGAHAQAHNTDYLIHKPTTTTTTVACNVNKSNKSHKYQTESEAENVSNNCKTRTAKSAVLKIQTTTTGAVWRGLNNNVRLLHALQVNG